MVIMITHEFVVVLGFKLMLFSTVSESTEARGTKKKNLAQVSTPISPCVSKGCLFSGVKLLHLRSTSHSFQVTLFFLPQTSSPDSQTLTRCTEFTDDSLIKPTL